MGKENIRKIQIAMITVMLMCCREVYNPPTSSQASNFLVVDGTIVNGQDSTVIRLSRTRSFADASVPSPELQAQLTVVGESGESFPLIEQGNGRYAIDQLTLNNAETYQLRIVTSNGKQYYSDKLSLKQTPAIDSLNWRQDSTGVTIYVNTHDPNNNTRYYRWDFTETWLYRTAFQTYADIQNGVPVPRFDQIYECWQSANSNDILVASSVKLSSDIIFQNPVARIPTGSEKLGVACSILVRQYALSEQAYDYWENLKKNTEELGSLFDAQPSLLNGNLHSIDVPDEPVLGYVDASTVDTQRIFIRNSSLDVWNYQSYARECVQSGFTDVDSISYFFPDGPNRRYVFLGTNLGTYLYSTLMCGDCRDHGGVNVKPAFWP
jgi:hypothetical protein